MSCGACQWHIHCQKCITENRWKHETLCKDVLKACKSAVEEIHDFEQFLTAVGSLAYKNDRYRQIKKHWRICPWCGKTFSIDDENNSRKYCCRQHANFAISKSKKGVKKK